jgi:uncharacterized membrane protein|tara:strand:- start:1907 stop:2584 length:678 start_codon:yes stop_codon:yes gene_type:complete
MLLAVAIGAGTVIVVAASYFYNFSGGFSDANSDWGDFGSFFGGTVGPVVAFLSFLALVITLLLQYSSLLETRAEVEQNNISSARSDFLRRFELEEKSLEVLVIDIVKALLFYITNADDSVKGKKKYKKMLKEYSNGERNVFLNYLKRFLVTDTNKDDIKKLFDYADSTYSLPLEQYVQRFDAMLEEARNQGMDIYNLIRWRASAKLFDILKRRYDQELKQNRSSS